MSFGVGQRMEKDDRLFIVAGALRGASVALGDQSLRLGAADDCDIALMSEEVGDAVLVVSSRADGLPLMTVVSGAVTVSGRTLPQGASRPIKRHTPVVMNGTTIMLAQSWPEAARAMRRRERRSTQLGWAACIAVAIGAAGVVVASDKGRLEFNETAGKETAIVGAGKTFVPLLAEDALRVRLEKDKLTSLDIQGDPAANVIRVSGALHSSDRERWDRVQKWFDATYAPDVQMETRITAARDRLTLPFSIQSVWMSPAPRLMLHDGLHSQVGDILPGGWRLDAIGPDEIEISRDGETLVLSL